MNQEDAVKRECVPTSTPRSCFDVARTRPSRGPAPLTRHSDGQQDGNG